MVLHRKKQIKFESDFGESDIKDNKIFLIKQIDERAKLYGNILKAISNLPQINQLFRKDIIINKSRSTFRHIRYNASFLGIFDVEGLSNNVITKFIDRFDICKYFPGYLRNKDIWDKLKGCNLNGRQFDNIVTGKNDAINRLDYCLNEISNKEKNMDKDISQETYKDKEINIITDDKDQIININIKTEQKTIEDAWS